MLQELHVKNLALIKEANITFGNKLNILTGETGAGKSILLGSINLALGNRASKDLIRDGSNEVSVELLFNVGKDSAIQDVLIKKFEEYEIPYDDGNIIIQRKVSKDKSSAKINMSFVTLDKLKEITELLIDIHGQHDSEELRKDTKHIVFLDNYLTKELKDLKIKLSAKYDELHSARKELKEFDIDENMKNREIDLLNYEIEEIDNANLKSGEEEDLNDKYKKISNSKNIIDSIYYAKESLDRFDISGAISKLKSVSKYDDSLEGLISTLYDIEQITNDAKKDIDSYVREYDYSESDLSSIEDRLDLIRNIYAKHGGDYEKTMKSYNLKTDRLNLLKNYDKEKIECEERVKKLSAELYDISKKISEIRKKGAKNFEKEVIAELKELGFLNVSFQINFEERNEVTKSGIDVVEFMISLNPGEKMRSLSDTSSGGELSRIMLSIKTILANLDETETLIFDEIDAGISGITASKVAEKLKKISNSRQVICITHLPQIAACSDTHYKIEKEVVEGNTYTRLVELDENGTINELGRLLGTGVMSESVIANAMELRNNSKR